MNVFYFTHRDFSKTYNNQKTQRRNKMLARIFYSIVILSLLAGLLTPLSGCALAQIAGGLGETSIKPAEKVKIEQPLKVEKEKVAGIKRIVVFSQTEVMKKAAPEDIRIQIIIERLLIAELEKNGSLQVITPATFQQKQKELGLEIDPTVMTKSEITAVLSKIVTALECDAVIGIYKKAHKVNMGKGLATYALMGRVSFDYTMILVVADKESGRDIWQQELNYTVSEGEMTRHNLTAEDLQKAFSPIIKTLTDDFFKSLKTEEPTVRAETKS